MITFLNSFNYLYEIVINFIAHILIFLGTFYVALHNRKLPPWHITPLWYVGLFSIFTAITIVVQWALGPEHPLSYFNIGRLSETLFNCAVATIAMVMLFGTAIRDYKESKKRRPQYDK